MVSNEQSTPDATAVLIYSGLALEICRQSPIEDGLTSPLQSVRRHTERLRLPTQPQRRTVMALRIVFCIKHTAGWGTLLRAADFGPDNKWGISWPVCHA